MTMHQHSKYHASTRGEKRIVISSVGTVVYIAILLLKRSLYVLVSYRVISYDGVYSTLSSQGDSLLCPPSFPYHFPPHPPTIPHHSPYHSP